MTIRPTSLENTFISPGEALFGLLMLALSAAILFGIFSSHPPIGF